jgi:hypothetical protein
MHSGFDIFTQNLLRIMYVFPEGIYQKIADPKRANMTNHFIGFLVIVR